MDAVPKIDLHIQTLASEGVLTLDNQFAYAKGNGLTALAIADRDVLPDLQAGQFLSKRFAVDYIPGIEVTAGFRGEEIHILGYRIDPAYPALRRRVEMIQAARLAHVQIMLYKLNQRGISLKLDDVFGPQRGYVGRLHIARALVERGHVATLRDAFSDRLIGIDGDCYFPTSLVSAIDVIALIEDSGGLPVLAHPGVYHRRLGMSEEELEELAEAGLRGIETHHPCHSAAIAERCAIIARKMGLFITGGSGCRGVNHDPIIRPQVAVPVESLPLLLAHRQVNPRMEGGQSKHASA